MIATLHNARYAKPRLPVGNRYFEAFQLLCCDGCERAPSRHLFNCSLMVTEQMQQESFRDTGFRRKCREASPDTNLPVRQVHDPDRCANAHKHIARFRKFGRRIGFSRRTSKFKVAKINFPLMEFHACGIVEGISSGRLPHVHV